MEMGVVTPPGPDLAEPGAIAFDLRAHRLLDPRMNKDARDLGIERGVPDQGDVQRREAGWIDRSRAIGQHRDRG